MNEIEELSYIGGQDRVVAAIEQLTGGEKQDGLLVRIAERFNENRIDWSGMETFADLFAGEMKKRIWPMVQNQGPITEDMLPEKMLNLYKSKKTGRYLVQIYPKKNLYKREALMRFNRIMERISPAVSGSPKLMLLMNDAVIKDGLKALSAAFLVILILLYLDFRSISTVLLAMLPLFCGTLFMLGVMILLGIKMNMMNVVVLAVIIGIGVDDGVHLMHRWRDEGIGGLKISASRVGHAILVTSITTMIGFGSVGFYPHRGMASLGYVLFIGVGACFLTTILVLPPVALFFEKRIMKKKGALKNGI
jgi:predicted RND superfamily exporter protein